jgi:hypothetical protein
MHLLEFDDTQESLLLIPLAAETRHPLASAAGTCHQFGVTPGFDRE